MTAPAMGCDRDPPAARKARGPDTPASISGPATVFVEIQQSTLNPF